MRGQSLTAARLIPDIASLIRATAQPGLRRRQWTLYPFRATQSPGRGRFVARHGFATPAAS